MPPLQSQPRPLKYYLAIGLLSVLLITTAVAAFLFYGSKEDYKNNVDNKIAQAVAQAEAVQAAKLEKDFAEQSKSPHKTYKGSATYGSVTFDYPKTWSAYVASSVDTPLDAYFHPDFVPAVDAESSYALRVEIVDDEYSQVVEEFSSAIEEGSLTARAYISPKMQNASGAQPGLYLDGELDEGLQGAIVVAKVRDKTLKIYTESRNFIADFEKIVLPSLTFVP
ncbi:MAG: hypothetical protein WD877_02990 [Candidatus Saccharimonadales bacterium]